MTGISEKETGILVGLNEIQQDLALAGDHQSSEKIRDIKKQMLQVVGFESNNNQVVEGYYGDALEQCQSTWKVIGESMNDQPTNDLELMLIMYAAEILSQRIKKYLSCKANAQGQAVEA